MRISKMILDDDPLSIFSPTRYDYKLFFSLEFEIFIFIIYGFTPSVNAWNIALTEITHSDASLD